MEHPTYNVKLNLFTTLIFHIKSSTYSPFPDKSVHGTIEHVIIGHGTIKHDTFEPGTIGHGTIEQDTIEHQYITMRTFWILLWNTLK